MGPILVFGHRNPDNDSICSAVAYAHLKNVTDPGNVYVPARLGPVPPETAWVFERFGVDLPIEIAHVHARVRDAMTANVVTASPEDNMLCVGRTMRERNVRALPVVDADGVVRGLINQRVLADLYIEETEIFGFEKMPVTVAELVNVLDGRLLAGDPEDRLRGRVLIGAMEPDTLVSYIHPGDTMVVGNRVRTQPQAIEAGAACIVISGAQEPDASVLSLANSRGAAVILTHYDTYAAARLVNLAHSVSGLMDSTPLMVSPEALLSEVAEDLTESPHREALVVDEKKRLVGVLTRTGLAKGARRQVILLDHNELVQSAPGVPEALVLEIIDHHRVGDVQTAAPVMFLNLPVGSTATIVAERYADLGVVPPNNIAGVLLSAVLTDTVLLKSPTTTSLDRTVVSRLAGQLELDATKFGLEMFRARSERVGVDPEGAVSTDLKEYVAGGLSIGVAQVESVDAEEYLVRSADLEYALDAFRERKGLDLALLLVTDVVREGSHVFASGKIRVAERGLGIDLSGGPVWMEGVLSRKKQVAAQLLAAAGA